MQIRDYKHSFAVGSYGSVQSFLTVNEALIFGLENLYGKNIHKIDFKAVRQSAYDYFTITHFYNAQDLESVECEVIAECGKITMHRLDYSNTNMQHHIFSLEPTDILISDLMKRD